MLNETEWRRLIDDVVIHKLVQSSRDEGKVETIFLTGSYARGVINTAGPNLNIYFIAVPARATSLRLRLAEIFTELRTCLREQGVELIIDCHPFTVSQHDSAWEAAPRLTITTKVFESELSTSSQRLGVAPTIGYGWWATHKVLLGEAGALDFLSEPPARDELWFAGASAALLSYRNMLDHLPWAIDPDSQTSLFMQEVTRYAEETIKDGVHFGLTDEEVVGGDALKILHDWDELAPAFFQARYGTGGYEAVRAVQRLKNAQRSRSVGRAEAIEAWRISIEVWTVIWAQFQLLSTDKGVSASHLTRRTWM